MSAYQEFTGKSVEEALKAAREAFKVELNDLDFEILTPGSRGVLGMGAEPARIVAAPRQALGGSAPKREAAAATPIPAAPARDDRGPRDDRPRREGDRDRGPRRDDRPLGPPRRAAPTDPAPPIGRGARPADAPDPTDRLETTGRRAATARPATTARRAATASASARLTIARRVEHRPPT